MPANERSVRMSKRRIVDAHHHLWKLSDGYNYPWLQDVPLSAGMLGDLTPIARDYLLADYRADTGNYDVTHSVHIEAVPADATAETRWLQDCADVGGLPSVVVARVELQGPDAERLIAEHRQFRRLRGIRHIVNWHPNPKVTFTDRNLLLDSAWQAGFALLKKYGLSFDLQLYPGQMGEAAALARRHPETPIMLNHTGMPVDRDADGVAAWRAGMKALAACDNVVAKISGLGMVDWHWSVDSIRPFVLETIDFFGTGRVMFGSNFPVDKLYSSFGTLYGAFETVVHSFSEAEKAALFHDNALRLYRI
jgi:predicted TIM-barrel fold metal-dependent hydrolase